MFNKITQTKNGARFYRVDLHIHTPASLDYKEKDVTAEKIVEKATRCKLNLIAITDHNTADKCYDVIEAAKGSQLVVLPGVEISVQGGKRGIHLLSIFDQDTPKNRIADLLARIGITSDKRGKQDALAQESIMKVLEEIQATGGIAIAAHADLTQGLVSDIRGQQRIAIVNNEKLCGMEIVNKETRQFFDGTDPNYRRKLPCIQCSDAHSLSEIGRRVTRLKMDKPCLEGVRQAFLDQESRIRLDDEASLCPYPYIIGMTVTGGFLDNQIIHFNKNLNCLIGGRGTGKSTVIELIRFCLDALPKSKAFLDRRLDMIKHVLAEGEVTVFIETKEGATYEIKRKFGDSPHVYTMDNKEISISPSSLFPIVGYGETEIEQISYDTCSQLALIDQFSDGLIDLKEAEEDLHQKLQKNAESVLTDQKKIQDMKQKLADLPSINEKLKVLQKHDFDTRLEKQRKRGEEKSLIKKIEDACSDVSEETTNSTMANEVSQVLNELPSDEALDQMPNKRIVKKAIGHFRRLHTHVAAQSDSEKRYVSTIIKKIEKISGELQTKHRTQERKTLELFQELEAEGEGEAARIYLELQEKRQELEGLQSHVSKLERHLNSSKKKRTKMLKQLEEKRRKIFRKRKECAQSLSERLGPKITIEIEHGGNTEKYCNALREALKGSRVYSRDIEKIVHEISPFEFCEIIEEKRDMDLINKADIADHWAQVIIHYEPLAEKLYEIQQVPLPDMPQILLEIGGKQKSPNSMSLGQRCTTLLSLIMLESELPLIIDTPEGGLDNIFVFDSVVQNLRTIKERRQIFLATHNANIPVSGDSELIVCLDSDGKKGWVSCGGSIDEEEMKERVQQVLEGGKEAFMIRKRKYGY